MSPSDRAIQWVAPYCDIVERLELVPPSASVRGLYLRNIEAQLAKRGVIDAYRNYFPDDRYASLSFYPASEFLIRQACAGALVASPKRIHEGMFLVAKGNATTFMETLLGRIMLRILSKDPVRVSEQGLAARRQSFTYGHWEIRRHTERAIEMVYQNEYWWIESAVAGAAQGTFEACGCNAELETKLIDRFNGSTFIRW
jgi:uncharacterized protein (TIGR02265 family)